MLVDNYALCDFAGFWNLLTCRYFFRI